LSFDADISRSNTNCFTSFILVAYTTKIGI
jgi:hypothetical protein